LRDIAVVGSMLRQFQRIRSADARLARATSRICFCPMDQWKEESLGINTRSLGEQ